MSTLTFKLKAKSIKLGTIAVISKIKNRMLHRSAGQNQWAVGWAVGSATAKVRASASLVSLKPKSSKTPRHVARQDMQGDMTDTAH